jgi:hypothetical protein
VKIKSKKKTGENMAERDLFGGGIKRDRYSDRNEHEMAESEMVGKGVNRVLDESWNIKMTMDSEIFDGIIKFLQEMGYSTIFRFNNKEVKLYIIDPSNTHASLVIIDKTEMAEYVWKSKINTDNEIDYEEPVYVDTDVIEDMRQLNSMDNQDNTLSTYEGYIEKLNNIWLKNESSFKMIIGHNGFQTVVKSLEKKKKSEIKFVHVKYGKNEIEFVSRDNVRSSSIMLYGEDIIIGGTRDVEHVYKLEDYNKFGKLKFTNNINLYVNENLPLIMETKFGASRIVLYYLLAPRDSDE